MTKSKSATVIKETLESLNVQIEQYKSKIQAFRLMNANLQKELEREKIRCQKFLLSEKRYRDILDDIQEGYFETDLNGRITLCNHAASIIIGRPQEVIIGTCFKNLTTEKATRIIRSVFGRLYQSGEESRQNHLVVIHRDNRTLTIEFTAKLIKDPNGQPLGFRGLFRDVSEQIKQKQKERRIQEQIQQAQKMEALGTLAGGLAHGFNNVLMAIQGNLSLITMRLPTDHPLQKQLRRINQSAEKGSRLSQEILSFAKARKFVVMPTNLNKILKSTSRMFTRSNPKLLIHEIFEKDLWSTRVDRVQIGQVLLGLYMNAAEAMPKGGDLFLQSENVHLDDSHTKAFGIPAGRYVKVSVTDSGKGLCEEAKRRIFEPFFSPFKPLQYEALGLAAAYGIIKSHKGLINVYSETGHGTTFNIYLPVTEKLTNVSTPKIEFTQGTETILLVDDDPASLNIGRDMLERLGYCVMTAESGAEAIDIYNNYKHNIHLVMLDMILPDFNGDQVYHRLKTLNANVLVILISGYNVNKQIHALLNQGCADFIQKPFQISLLHNKIRTTIERKVV